MTRNNTAVLPRSYGARPTPVPVKLSILMAAYNEERTITRVVRSVFDVDYPCDIELIVVNDGSSDRTPQLLEQINDPRVIVHHHLVNRGKGAGLISAMALATGTHILPFDADLEYLPEDIPRLLEPIIRGKCNVVYGTRMFGINTVHRSYWYAVGNRFLSRLANLLFDSCISDLHTCLKLIPLEMVKALTLTETGFGLDTEITASLLRHGVRPFEVPISYYSRSRVQGKKINWRDAVECILILFRVRLRRDAARPECFSSPLGMQYQAPAFASRPVRALQAHGYVSTSTFDPAAYQQFSDAEGRMEAVSEV
jgi:dolichol-phosphate hexosyltransferase